MLEHCYTALRGPRTGDDHESAAGSFVVMLCVSLKNSFTIHLAALRMVTTARITMHILILYVYIVAYCFTI
jgi:hypothetical protein